MKRTDWGSRKRTERRYQQRLAKLAERLSKQVRQQKTLDQIVDSLLKLLNTKWFLQYCHQEALNMVKSVVVENARTWREAAKLGTHSAEIHHLLRREFENHARFNDLIYQNAEYIKTIPQTMAERITAMAAKEAQAGRRTDEIIKAIHGQAPHLAHWQAMRIARTEVAKAQSTVTKVRAQQIGIDQYVWRTAQDQRVRSSHKHMEGVICRYSDPPAPERLDGEKSQGHYGPGEIYNCRCYAEPVIDAEFLPESIKVLQGGQIVRMTRAKFEALGR
jgi:SPP1 gp7 family putative phage head morphogenesis protein